MFNLEDKIFPIPNDKTFIPIKNKFSKKHDVNKYYKKNSGKSRYF